MDRNIDRYLDVYRQADRRRAALIAAAIGPRQPPSA